ncbi:MAG TPA: glycosyltransferase [Gemmatimonadaceae bacterium]|nr:glycosyltransferase [Gemmatimonadaceae bacterium]
MPDVGVVALVPDYWGWRWQPRQQVLTRLARYYHVAWVEPARGWRELWRRHQPMAAEDAAIPLLPGFHRYDPGRWLPLVHKPSRLGAFLFRQRVRRARALLERQGCRRVVLYLWRPKFEAALHAAHFDATCYHVDDEYSFSPVESPLSAAESRILRQVDQVFIHSPALMEKKGDLNPHTLFVPNGVDYASFAGPVPEPADLAPIPHPRVGYAGAIKRQLDWSVLRRLAHEHPEWSFVFVGSRSPHPELGPILDELSALEHVHFLGAKSTHELGRYPQHFDVCLMPYKADDYTKYIYPLKLHEYLASGRPVVGTRIRSLEQFEDVVALAESPEDWERETARALTPAESAEPRRHARQRVARQHDWHLLVAQVAGAMAERLGPEVARRFHACTTDAGFDVVAAAGSAPDHAAARDHAHPAARRTAREER